MNSAQTRYDYRAVWWLTGLGLCLRAYHYGRNPAMWHDEAATVLNILRKSFADLLGPLYGSATGPPIFLWLQKCMVLALGDGIYILRLVPFLASCAGLLLMAVLARRMLEPLAAAGAVLIVACADRLLWHSVEARHYPTDFLIAVGLLFLLVGTRTWPARSRASSFAAAVPLIIFASYPGVFLCGGVFIALLPTLYRDGWKGRAAAVGLAAVIAASFAAFYIVTIQVQRTTAVDAAWVTEFPDWIRPWSVPFWFLKSSVGVVDYMARPIGGVLIVAAFLGAAWFWRNGRNEIVLFAAVPVLLAAIAALAKAYPYTGARTMVFAMPGIVLLIGAGIGRAVFWAGRSQWRRGVVAATAGLPLLATLFFSLYRTVIPWPRADTSGASAYVLEERQGDEPVTANHYEYEFYFRTLGDAFYPDLRLLDVKDLPERYWIVVTSKDSHFREQIAERLPSSRILERREFERTTVFHVAQGREL